jgi:hypothetical protein
LNAPSNTAEWIFAGPVKKGDYHKNRNSTNFKKWIDHLLFPAFAAKYPGKKMILVLYNAPYHHVHAEDYIDPSNMKRTKFIEELLLIANQKSITVERDGISQEFDLSEARKEKRGGKNSPTVQELKKALQLYLDVHPELQRSELQEMFDNLQHLIFTPPYTPVLQSIEMTWAFVKNQVADRYEYGRTMKETTKQLLEAFYGQDPSIASSSSDESRKFYDAKMCLAHIKHTDRFCNEFLESDPRLFGTINQLEVSNEGMQESEALEIDAQLEAEPQEASDTYFRGEDPIDDDEQEDCEKAYSDSEMSDEENDQKVADE